jgi:hypothetical protein
MRCPDGSEMNDGDEKRGKEREGEEGREGGNENVTR